MANIFDQIIAYEDAILENISTFVSKVFDDALPIYIIGKPSISPDKPYIGIRIITSNDSGGWGQTQSMSSSGAFTYVMDQTYTIEIMAYRGRPITALSYLLSAFRGWDELKYQYLISKGIGFLSASNISQSNTVLDGDKTEQRARLVLTFNSRLISEDTETSEIVGVNATLTSSETYWKINELSLEFTREFPSLTFILSSSDLYKFIDLEGLPKLTYSTWYNTWITS